MQLKRWQNLCINASYIVVPKSRESTHVTQHKTTWFYEYLISVLFTVRLLLEGALQMCPMHGVWRPFKSVGLEG